MKKRIVIVSILLILVISLVGVLVACKGKDVGNIDDVVDDVIDDTVDDAVENTLSFIVDDEEYSTSSDGTITFPENPTKDGYTFDGWVLKDGSAFTVDSARDISLNGKLSVYAKWTATEYNIEYMLYGGTVTPANPTKYTVESLDITLNNPTREGYTFQGWSGTGLDGDTNKNVTIVSGSIGNREYTANWNINQYTISFESNGGSAVGSITQDYATTVTKPSDPIKANYDFKGWYRDNTTFNNAYTFDTMPAENFTLYAKWTLTEYTITYILSGGSSDNPTKYTIESPGITLSNPDRTGYTFTGWSGTGLDGSANMNVTITNGSSGHREYTAHWQGITCTVSFEVNGGNSSHSAVDITSGDTIAFPVPTHSDENMMFLGWYTNMGSKQITDTEGVGLELWANDNTTITLYAMWRNTSCDISSYLRVDGDEANTPNPTGTHILFGEYPQTLKVDSVTMTNFQDARGYYLGNDGFYYAKVVATPYEGNYKFSDNITVVIQGPEYYFKVEPIKWRILNYSTLAQDDNKALILCESIIANKRYNESYLGTQNGVYANNYKESEIRAWLNNEFYNNTFSELQKQLIEITEVDNSVYSTGYDENQHACQNTNDKIFLPSYREVTNTEYGFSSSESRKRKTSDYSRATGAYMNTDSSYYGNGYWWLRSPDDSDSNYARGVLYGGDVYSNKVDSTGGSVLPALVISLT